MKMLIPLFMLFLAGQSLAEKVWVSDDLTIMLRSGAGNEYRIIKSLKSGQQLETGDESADGNWAMVSIPGSDVEGWVLKNYLSNAPTSALQLAKQSSELQSLKEKLQKLSSDHSALQKESSELKKQLQSSESQLADANKTNAHYESVAAEPIRLSQRNEELNTQVSLLQAELAQLRTENTRLSNDNFDEAMIAGAAIMFFSLLLGWFITKSASRSRSVWR